jgi:aspartate/methionine/tyrosine aminotransferase
VVSPANPTGAVLEARELRAIEDFCAERGLALVGDEVFADTATVEARSVAASPPCLAFHLSGLSKVCGLPQLKVAWIAVAGPAGEASRAVERLEMIADAYLSVNGPSQLATPELLRRRARFLAPLRERLQRNEDSLARSLPAGAPFDALRRLGGWSAVLRVGETLDEERICLELLERGVVVQPGFFYDFSRAGYLVVSLLPETEVFRRGVEIVVETLGTFRQP